MCASLSSQLSHSSLNIKYTPEVTTTTIELTSSYSLINKLPSWSIAKQVLHNSMAAIITTTCLSFFVVVVVVANLIWAFNIVCVSWLLQEGIHTSDCAKRELQFGVLVFDVFLIDAFAETHTWGDWRAMPVSAVNIASSH